MNISKRSFAFALALIGVLSGATIGTFVYVYAAGSVSDATFEAGTQVATASYVLWREGVTYYAKNGSTGVIDYTSSNASEILSNVVASNTRLYLRAGIYQAAQYNLIENVANLTIEGELGAIIRMADSLTYAHGFRIINSAHVTIRNLAIDGNKAGGSTYGYGIDYLNSTYGRFEDLHLYDMIDAAFQIEGSNNTVIQHCLIENIGSAVGHDTAIRFAGYGAGSHNNTAANNVIRNCGEHGIKSYNLSTNNTITGNTIYNVSREGIQVSYRCIVTANRITKTGWNGLLLTGSDNIVTDNIIDNAGTNGIIIYATAGNIVSGNTIRNSGAHGLYIYQAYNNTIVGNQINANGDNGIYFGSPTTASNMNILIGNVVRANSNKGVWVAYGDYNIVVACSVWDNAPEIIVNATFTHNKVNLCWNGSNWIT